MHEQIYNAAIYVRLSKEDVDFKDSKKTESNSISNQKNLILDYLKKKPEIHVVSTKIDDGYTGTNYDRPAFQEMLEDIKAGVVNCVIVKDLSRFGREYIDAGKYISRLFPFYGVRLIAINDNVDTITSNSSDEFNITIRNLFNDNYCRDISVKIRSQLTTKRKNGEFIGAFAPYGYRKKETDHNALEIDEYAATVIQDIFKWKLEGMSQDGIAKKLNRLGILSPMDYKRSQGMKYKSGFRINTKSGWTPVAVRRILTNPVYTGTLVQGVRTTPNYKIKTVVVNEQEDWIRIAGTHEAIVANKSFDLVQKLLSLDTRTSPDEDMVFTLSGLLLCSDCNSPMVRKVSTVGGKKYVYYLCSGYKTHHTCSSHRIKASVLENTVLRLLREHISLVVEMDKCLAAVAQMPYRQVNLKKAEERLMQADKQRERYTLLKTSAYEDMKDGLLSKEDYLDIVKLYDGYVEQALEAKVEIQREIDTLINSTSAKQGWMQEFMKHRNLQQLTRSVVVECIEQIYVYEDDRLSVEFSHAQNFKEIMENLSSYDKTEQREVG